MLRALVLTLAILLVFALQAAAECAWVLWENIVGNTTTTEPVRSYPTKPECDRAVVVAPGGV